LTELGLHLACLQEGQNQRKLSPWLKKDIKIEEGTSRASLLVHGTTIATNAIDWTGNNVDSTTTYNLDHQSFNTEAKKDK
jgi:hypothetical protein